MTKVAVLDDDKVFADTLARRLGRKGYDVAVFYQIRELLYYKNELQHLLLDMNLDGESSIHSLPKLRQKWPDSQILILTGYASIASTVLAIKNGADDYLTKPLDFGALCDKMGHQDEESSKGLTKQSKVLTPAQLEWEHIQRVLQESGGNISAAARTLSMHRRTLQRKLQKKPVWE